MQLYSGVKVENNSHRLIVIYYMCQISTVLIAYFTFGLATWSQVLR